MRKLLIIPIVVVSSASSAGDAVMLEAGAYEVQMRLELPHVETMNVQKTAQVCIIDGGTRGIVVMSENNPLARCPASNIKQTADELVFDLICEGHNQAVAQAKFQLLPDRFSGAFEMKMGGKNMTMTERQTGRRIGTCADRPRS